MKMESTVEVKIYSVLPVNTVACVAVKSAAARATANPATRHIPYEAWGLERRDEKSSKRAACLPACLGGWQSITRRGALLGEEKASKKKKQKKKMTSVCPGDVVQTQAQAE